MKNNKLCAAVIGMGEGFRHIKAYLENPEYELIALCDKYPERIQLRLGEYGLNSSVFQCQDYRELLSIPELDVVSVTSPDYFHAEQAIACLEAGKHVLCEKPMTLDLNEAQAMIEAVRRTGKVFMVGHPTRYTPAFVLARIMIQRGDIGELCMVESEYAHNYRHLEEVDHWRRDARRDPLLGGGCHAVDLIRWITGDRIDEAFAYANKKCLTDWPVAADTYLSLFRFHNGVIGKVMCSIGISCPYTMRSVFYGTRGTILCDNTSTTMQLSSVPFYNSSLDAVPFVSVPVNINNHNVEHEIALMSDIILRGAENHAGVLEGAETVAACVAAIESARTGRTVKVKSDF